VTGATEASWRSGGTPVDSRTHTWPLLPPENVIDGGGAQLMSLPNQDADLVAALHVYFLG